MKVDDLYRARCEEAQRGEVSRETENAFWHAATMTVARVFRRRGYDRSQSDDLVQECMIIVHRKLSEGKFEPDGPHGFSRYVKEIARRVSLHNPVVLTARQKKKLRMLEAVNGPTLTPSTWTAKREQQDVVAQLQPKLTTAQREALEYPDHFALAEARGLTVDAAKKRWDRAVARLRKAWANFRKTTIRLRKVTPS